MIIAAWVTPSLVIPALLLLITSYYVRNFYLGAASRVARLEAISIKH